MAPGKPPRSVSLEQRVEVETPEQVVFAYTIAGAGSRAAAAMIDYLIIIAIMIAVNYVGSVTISTFRGAALSNTPAADWTLAMVIILTFLAFWGYFVLFEGLNDGQTPGKQIFGLRVVQDGGYSVSFAASAVRNIVRIVDWLPGVYLVGAIAILLSRTAKRLGDHAAGTIVVQERAVHVPFSAEEQDAGAAPLSAQLSDDEYGLLERYLARRDSLLPDRREEFDQRLAQRLRGRLPVGDEHLGVRLRKLYVDEKALRARGVASRSDTGAAREQHAIVAAGASRWKTFAASVAVARKRGLKRMAEDEVADFVGQYREVSTDLARLRTASRGRESDSAFYLSRLIAAGHNLLYRQRQLIPLMIWNFIAGTVPREVRRSARPILLAALLLFGPAAVSFVAIVRHPASAIEILPPGMIDRAEGAVERQKRGGGYLPDAMADDRGAALSSSLAANNVQVSMLAFAMGITAGIGTAYVLFINGIMLGSVLGLFDNHNVLQLILRFVVPHGVLEMTAICLAGGAGFLIGAAFLLPGSRTRREALVINGRRSLRLMTASALFLVVAGLIEGFISPRNLPMSMSVTIGVVSGIGGFLYFMLGRGRAEENPEEEFAYSEARPLSSR